MRLNTISCHYKSRVPLYVGETVRREGSFYNGPFWKSHCLYSHNSYFVVTVKYRVYSRHSCVWLVLSWCSFSFRLLDPSRMAFFLFFVSFRSKYLSGNSSAFALSVGSSNSSGSGESRVKRPHRRCKQNSSRSPNASSVGSWFQQVDGKSSSSSSKKGPPSWKKKCSLLKAIIWACLSASL